MRRVEGSYKKKHPKNVPFFKSTHNLKGGETQRNSYSQENAGLNIQLHSFLLSVSFPTFFTSPRNVKPFHSPTKKKTEKKKL